MKRKLQAPEKTITPENLQSQFEWNGWIITRDRNNNLRISSDRQYEEPKHKLFSKVEIYKSFLQAYCNYGILLLNSIGKHTKVSEVMNGNNPFFYVTSVEAIIEDGDEKYIEVTKRKGNGQTVYGLLEYDTLKDVILTTEQPRSNWRLWTIEDIYDGIAKANDGHGNFRTIPMVNFPQEFANNVRYQVCEYLGNHTFQLDNTTVDYTNNLNNLLKFKFVIVLTEKDSTTSFNDDSFNLSTIQLDGHDLRDKDRLLVLQENSNQAIIICYRRMKWRREAKIQSKIILNDSVPNIGYGRNMVFDKSGDFNEDDIKKILNDVKQNNSIVIPQQHQSLEKKYLPISNGAESTKSVLVEVYNNTVDFVKTRQYKTQNGPVTLNLSPNLTRDTIFYSEEITPVATNEFAPTEYKVLLKDCLDVAHDLHEELIQAGADTDSIAVLNMANRRRPGGRPHVGARTQEAYLIRCSDYYRSTYQFDAELAEKFDIPVADQNKRYPLDRNFGGIFSPKVTIFRKSEKDGYALLDHPWQVNMIAVAGCRRPTETSHDVIEEYILCSKNKIRTILRIAIANHQTNLILGPMGCGGLYNIPETVANLFFCILKEEEFKNKFERVYFAILDKETYEAFDKELGAFNNEQADDAQVVEAAQEEVKRRREYLRRFPTQCRLKLQEFQDIVKKIEGGRDFTLWEVFEQMEYNHVSALYGIIDFIQRHRNITPLPQDTIEDSLMGFAEDDINDLMACFDDMEEMEPSGYVDQLHDEGFDDEELILLCYIKYIYDHPEMQFE